MMICDAQQIKQAMLPLAIQRVVEATEARGRDPGGGNESTIRSGLEVEIRRPRTNGNRMDEETQQRHL